MKKVLIPTKLDAVAREMLKNHGSLNVGKSMEAALAGLERLEHTAKVVAYARMLGKVENLSTEEMQALHAMLS